MLAPTIASGLKALLVAAMTSVVRLESRRDRDLQFGWPPSSASTTPESVAPSEVMGVGRSSHLDGAGGDLR